MRVYGYHTRKMKKKILTKLMLKTISTSLVVASLVSYCFYFDYKRRTDSEFRRNLKRQNKQVRDTLAVKDTPNNNEIPTSQKEIEEYFMLNLQQGEQLMLQGSPFYNEASECFLKALKVYPDPQKLLQVLSQSLPQEVSELIILKMQQELKMEATIEEIE